MVHAKKCHVFASVYCLLIASVYFGSRSNILNCFRVTTRYVLVLHCIEEFLEKNSKQQLSHPLLIVN